MSNSFAPFRKTIAIVVSSTLFLSVLSAGCASRGNKASAKPQRPSADDASFAAGARRAPTPATSYGLAKILIGQGRDRDALYVLQRILREQPKFLPACNEIAGIYVRSDRLDDAVEALSAGLKHSPDDAVLNNNLGMCHFLKGEHERALQSFTHASQRSPSNPVYHANRAAALAMLGRDAEAREEYRSVLDTPATRRNLAILAQARGAQANAAEPAEVKPDPALSRAPADNAAGDDSAAN